MPQRICKNNSDKHRSMLLSIIYLLFSIVFIRLRFYYCLYIIVFIVVCPRSCFMLLIDHFLLPHAIHLKTLAAITCLVFLLCNVCVYYRTISIFLVIKCMRYLILHSRSNTFMTKHCYTFPLSLITVLLK
jgi:hypothetical protein